jgi:hypothetical protein
MVLAYRGGARVPLTFNAVGRYIVSLLVLLMARVSARTPTKAVPLASCRDLNPDYPFIFRLHDARRTNPAFAEIFVQDRPTLNAVLEDLCRIETIWERDFLYLGIHMMVVLTGKYLTGDENFFRM